jgi:hypothetical protein
VKSPFDGFAYPARQVDVCRVDDDPFRLFVDANDSVEWMLALFGFLLMAHQANHLLNLPRPEVAVQSDHAGRKLVVDTPASRTPRDRPRVSAPTASARYDSRHRIAGKPCRLLAFLAADMDRECDPPGRVRQSGAWLQACAVLSLFASFQAPFRS